MEPIKMTELERLVDRLELIAGKIYNQSGFIQDKLLGPVQSGETSGSNISQTGLLPRMDTAIRTLEMANENIGGLLENII